MERKIGEIFEYNGEWYQCIKQPEDFNFMSEVCKICAFQGTENCDVDECSDSFRSDKQDVIFKKLEKVGEPYQYIDGIYQQYKATLPFFIRDATYIETINGFAVIIKQNQEDMEEKKIQHYDCFFDKKELNLKPFDLEAAKAGKPVCTRDGRKVRIICFDKEDIRPIVALIKSDKGGESAYYYYINGMNLSNNHQSVHDLMMLPEKKEGWINLYKYYIRPTKEEAMKHRNNCSEYIDTVKVEWEE